MGRIFLFVILTFSIAGCFKKEDEKILPTSKITGSNVKELTEQKLEEYNHDCTKYGKMDDVQVTYTLEYCREIMDERNSRSFKKAGNRNVKNGLPTAK